MKTTIVLLAVGALVGCVSRTSDPYNRLTYERSGFRNHSFEERLYVADPNVPLLSEHDWSEVASALSIRHGYVLESALLRPEDTLSVRMHKGGVQNQLPDEILLLVFKKRHDHWVEDPSEETHIPVCPMM